MPSLKHLHTYMRVTGKEELYMCSDPDCTHYLNKSFLTGKKALCFYCGNEFTLTPKRLDLKIPHCENCTRTKRKSQEFGLVSDLLRSTIDEDLVAEEEEENDATTK